MSWTKEMCKEEAIKYSNRKEFGEGSPSAYNASYRNGWMSDICDHMKHLGNLSNRAIYCFEFEDNCVYIGLTFNLNKRKNEHLTNEKSSVYKHIKKTGLIPKFKKLTDYINTEDAIKEEGFKIDEYKKKEWIILNITKHGALGSSIFKWDYDACKKEALKYNDRSLFMRLSSGARKSASINGWLKDITSHMDVKVKKDYWTKELCHIEALKYLTKNKFKNNSCGAYTFAYRNNLLDEICSHMIKFHTGFRGYKKK